MTGDWIKIRVDLTDDPAVLRLAKIVGLDRWAIVGRLSDVWSWVGGHTQDGIAVQLDADMIDDRVRLPGFADAMRAQQWLTGEDGALNFPKWDRHNSNSAKARALESEAKSIRRKLGKASDNPAPASSDNCPTNKAADVRPEKRREEYIHTPIVPMTPKGPSRAEIEFSEFWEAYPRKIGKKAAQKVWRKAKDRPALDQILSAIARAMRSDQWIRDDGQFIPHPSTWLAQGRWDDGSSHSEKKVAAGITEPDGWREALFSLGYQVEESTEWPQVTSDLQHEIIQFLKKCNP